MKGIFGGCFALGMMLAAGVTQLCQGAMSDLPQRKVTITIHVYSYAEVTPEIMRSAEKVASKIFQKADVEIRWCNAHQESGRKEQPSADAEPLHSSEIMLRILPQSMTERFGLTAERLGFAPGNGANRQDAYVFYDRTEQFVRQQTEARLLKAVVGIVERSLSISELMGEIMAHEVGHLLGIETHSSAGIMTADWGSTDLGEITYGELFFTRSQAEIIRGELSKRIGNDRLLKGDNSDKRNALDLGGMGTKHSGTAHLIIRGSRLLESRFQANY